MKPRNHVILAMIRGAKSSGFHGKSKKAIRKAENQRLKREISVLN